MDVKIFFVILCLTLGSFLIIVASIGVVRFPDFYTRVHAAGKVDTLGQSLILLALILYEGASPLSLKIFLIIILIYIVNPSATHFVTQAAYLARIWPFEKDKKQL
ncbi:MAG: monovalent cation/H(+) antiporter subunit G [Syntrophomonadaceae bacterium]|jgi:multicomponent Na+:H+ antiporter subunit G|nr:monovalent cation/H(+) antiporter subunit G [Syntrophomonadaceae bacterium]